MYEARGSRSYLSGYLIENNGDEALGRLDVDGLEYALRAI
jgi:hypothetical protein